jgi:hypothetical protein
MCQLPGPHHTGPTDCISAMQKRLAALTNDPAMIPAPPEPMPPFDVIMQRARDRYRENIEHYQKLGLLWNEPTAAEIARVTGLH